MIRFISPGRLRSAKALQILLLSCALLDELTTGFLVLGLPLVRDTLHFSCVEAGLLVTAGQIASAVIEPPMNFASDRVGKRLLILAGLASLVAPYLLASATLSYPLRLLTFVLVFPAMGAAAGLAQAALVDLSPTRSAPIMARRTLFAAVGDLLAPVVVALLVASGQGWSALCLFAAGVWLVVLLLVLPQRFSPAPITIEEEARAGILTEMCRAVLDALGNRRLLRWVVVLLMATMIDEEFLGFAGLLLHDRLHAPVSLISLAIGGQMAAGLLALAALDRLLARGRIQAIRLLPCLAVVTLIGVLLLLTAPAFWIAALTLVIIDVGSASWYPIAKAAAYDTLPGHTGTVRAVESLAAPVEMALPAVTGLVAGPLGIVAGVALLGAAPLGILLFAPRRK